jgi:hypothetical protein
MNASKPLYRISVFYTQPQIEKISPFSSAEFVLSQYLRTDYGISMILIIMTLIKIAKKQHM